MPLACEQPAKGFFHSDPRFALAKSLSAQRCSRRRLRSLRPAPRPRVLLLECIERGGATLVAAWAWYDRYKKKKNLWVERKEQTLKRKELSPKSIPLRGGRRRGVAVATMYVTPSVAAHCLERDPPRVAPLRCARAVTPHTPGREHSSQTRDCSIPNTSPKNKSRHIHRPDGERESAARATSPAAKRPGRRASHATRG
jgi:hypothetical protein